MAKVFQVNTASGGTLLTSLADFFKLDESSGNRTGFYVGTVLTDNNTVGATTGILSNAADLVLLNLEYLSLADGSIFNGTNDFSVSFWIKSTSIVSSTVCSNDVNTKGWEIKFNQVSGKLTLYLNDGTNFRQFRCTTSVNGGSYTHCVVTRSGQGINWYINNGSAEATDVGSSGTIGDLTHTNPFAIGNDQGATYLTAAIDEFGFWNKVLSADEITDLYNSGNGNTMIDSVNSGFLTFMGPQPQQ